MKKSIYSLLCALLIFVSYQAYRITLDSGALLDIEPLAYGNCQKIHGPPSSEDINIDAKHQVAFISAGNGREVFNNYRSEHKKVVPSGDIWLLDLSEPDSKAIPLGVELEHAFYPHGIDLLHLDNGARELYVINHPALDEHEVLIFDVLHNHRLSLKTRIQYPALISPNDIKAISSHQFFVTNDHGSPRSSFLHRLEDYLGLKRASVSYYDGKTGSLMIKGLKSANGISLTADQKTLYIAEAVGRSIKKFERGKSVTDWTLSEKLSLNTAADNLEWSDSGQLLSGTHPKLFDFLAHAKDPAYHSPSQVISIDVSSTPMRYDTLYMNHGEEISGSSVATMLNGEMLIGSVFESHFLRCQKQATQRSN